MLDQIICLILQCLNTLQEAVDGVLAKLLAIISPLTLSVRLHEIGHCEVLIDALMNKKVIALLLVHLDKVD